MSCELNINAVGSDGNINPEAVIECIVLSTDLRECPFQPKIKKQSNFFSDPKTFREAMEAKGYMGPYFIYGTATAPGANVTYFPAEGGFGIPWDGNQSLTVTVKLSFKSPFRVAPRFWKGDMCGSRVQGISPVAGGAVNDPSLVLSWFYDRYSVADRARIRAAWKARDLTHVLLSWPDARGGDAQIVQAVALVNFRMICQELIADGFYPCVMLTSKDYDSPDVNAIMAGLVPVLNELVGIVPMFCVGWELSLWLTPTQVQQLIDRISPTVKRQEGTLLYVHFQQGYPSFQQDGGTVADFWNPNIGKLDGLLYQKFIDQNDAQFLDSLKDCLERFAGGFNMVKGFDFVALELTAMTQYNGQTSEAEGRRVGSLAINAPKVNGVGVSGSGNGFQQ